MVAPLPVQKILIVALKQMAKPFAARLVAFAETTPRLRKYILAPIGQARHRAEVIVTAWNNGKTRPEFIAPLTEKVAVVKGTDILLNLTLIATLIIIFLSEYFSSAAKEEKLREQQKEKLDELQLTLHDFSDRLKQRSKYMGEIDEKLQHMESRVKLLEAKK